jgi:hypothetical protein
MKTSYMIGLITLIILLITIGPLAVIWALNTLFGLTIPFTIWTWLAVIILNLTISSTNIKKR